MPFVAKSGFSVSRNPQEHPGEISVSHFFRASVYVKWELLDCTGESRVANVSISSSVTFLCSQIYLNPCFFDINRTEDGESFVVKDPDVFASTTIPQYFDHSTLLRFVIARMPTNI